SSDRGAFRLRGLAADKFMKNAHCEDIADLQDLAERGALQVEFDSFFKRKGQKYTTKDGGEGVYEKDGWIANNINPITTAEHKAEAREERRYIRTEIKIKTSVLQKQEELRAKFA